MAELTLKRGRVKAALTRIETSINAKPDMTAAEAQVRLEKLEECWKEFEIIQSKIEEDEPAQNTAAFRTANETERQQFEEKFYGLAGKMQQKIEERREQQEQRFRANQNQHQNNGQDREANPIRLEIIHRNKPRLPEMRLKEFDGDFTNWIFFKNSFEIIIDGDNDLLPIQKHQYLIGVLKGEALKVIEGFSINGENYENAWQLLKDTYDNERVIIETHLDALLTFPPVTKEDKAEALKKLVWHIQTHTQSLKTLSQPVDQWDTLIIHMARRGLDYTEQKEWQDRIKDKTPTNMPKLSEFIAFLTEKSHMLRLLNQSNKEIPSDTTAGTIPQKGKKGRNNVTLGLTASTCKYCDGEHPIFRCEEFLKLNQKERKQQVIEKKLCLNCLKHGHMARDCTSSTCRKCNGKHNSLLHAESTQQPENKDTNSRATVNYCTEKDNTDADNTDAAVSLYCMNKPLSQVILSTAQVYVHGKGQQRVKCRVLLDPGSQINLITQKLVKKLNLPCSQVDKTVSGINQAVISASKSVTITIESIHKKFSSEITCTILPSITERLPQTRLEIEKIQQPTDVVLADPGYSEPGEIELLIGAGLYWKMIIGAPQNPHDGQPTWQNRKLGWICGGEPTGTKAGSTATCCKVTNVQLHHQLERFWKQEAIPEEKHFSKEEQEVEKYFQETTQQNADGRFIVKLPLKSDVTLGHSKYQAERQAERRLQAIERRFTRDPALKTAYTEFLEDYSAQNHMDLVEDVEAVEAVEHYYIPHQPVVRPDSITTKVRLVFDASARTDSGNSLNDKLSPGPNLQGDLLQIIIRFRTHEIVITGDVAQMYRQIQVHPEHQRYQLILWRNNDNENVKTYKLNTVTYGPASAPFHALRTVKELAIKFKDKYPLGAKVLEEDLYMDDALSGGSTVAYVKETQKQLAEILLCDVTFSQPPGKQVRHLRPFRPSAKPKPNLN